MVRGGIDWLDALWRQMSGCEEEDVDELSEADDDLAQDAGHDLIYDVDCEDTWGGFAETREQVVEEGNAAAEEEGGPAPGAEEWAGGEEGGPEAGAEEGDREDVGGPEAGVEEADDEETESEHGDAIHNDQEGQADEEDDEEVDEVEDTEYMDAGEGDNDDDRSDDEDDEETKTDFSDASDDGMEEGERDEQANSPRPLPPSESPSCHSRTPSPLRLTVSVPLTSASLSLFRPLPCSLLKALSPCLRHLKCYCPCCTPLRGHPFLFEYLSRLLYHSLPLRFFLTPLSLCLLPSTFHIRPCYVILCTPPHGRIAVFDRSHMRLPFTSHPFRLSLDPSPCLLSCKTFLTCGWYDVLYTSFLCCCLQFDSSIPLPSFHSSPLYLKRWVMILCIVHRIYHFCSPLCMRICLQPPLFARKAPSLNHVGECSI
ncbi:unnamed protein product [Closterium sp. Naga37s-1]|nr:unnamed protein product [Closterium sp. Naga37s-1]